MLNTIASVVVILGVPLTLSLHLFPRWIPKQSENLYCWLNAHCWGADDYQGPNTTKYGQPYESWLATDTTATMVSVVGEGAVGDAQRSPARGLR